MRYDQILACLECDPVIAAIRDDGWDKAIASPARVIFHLSANLLDVNRLVSEAHAADKFLFIHMDLAEGIGRDRTGIGYLAQCGVDGIISTKAQLIKFAKELNLVTVQRFFALDSRGLDSIQDMLRISNPHFMEIMPGVIGKAILRFSSGGIAVIAGGLVQTKSEVTDALRNGATAVSTGQPELWYL